MSLPASMAIYITKYINEKGYNITFQEYYNVSSYSKSYRLLCPFCGCSASEKIPYEYTDDQYLDVIVMRVDAFASSHTHNMQEQYYKAFPETKGETIKFYSYYPLGADQVYNETEIVGHTIGQNINLNAPYNQPGVKNEYAKQKEVGPVSIADYYNKYYKTYGSVFNTQQNSGTTDFSSDIKLNIGNAPALNSNILKELYKHSDFNVELQSRKGMGTSDCRAICTKCEGTLNINYKEVISTDRTNETWASLYEFCKTHKHGVEIQESPKGRKFKNV